MSVLQFVSPPLPHYIASGYTIFHPGDKHMSRRNIGVFDLLVVTRGCLFIGEEDRHYEVSGGHALILRPDRHHYPTKGCEERTEYYWLHFDTTGKWGQVEEAENERPREPSGEKTAFTMETFTMLLPQFVSLPLPKATYEPLRQLSELEQESHMSWARWKLQLIFQGLLEQLSSSLDRRTASPGAHVAEQAASYLRMHYKEEVTARQLGEALNFHPVYIARCMQKEYGVSPFDYLLRYRIEQAKLLLLQTNHSIALIAEMVGFNQAAYFASCFAKVEGIPPRTYRQRFYHI
ncbi:AraC family transcriptional regulator [Paenibacillus sp. H1-7]|uniref:helix-turn-helix transcriptional regulator n=1 Tax=Paenibacillus sp. H1-7 TaxID=2282849 RepID=UPI001EF809C7|nr:AraC family transcriptional regulator [Paenibacillus sp. H1-7]ULL13603.1 AraC family transcriptional regulator [Paenibacillus sp. H1-7]